MPNKKIDELEDAKELQSKLGLTEADYRAFEETEEDLKRKIIRKMSFYTFAHNCLWLLISDEEQKHDGFRPRDLQRAARIARPVAYDFFETMVSLGLMTKDVKTSVYTIYRLSFNDGHIKLLDYLPYIKHTLKDRYKGGNKQ